MREWLALRYCPAETTSLQDTNPKPLLPHGVGELVLAVPVMLTGNRQTWCN